MVLARREGRSWEGGRREPASASYISLCIKRRHAQPPFMASQRRRRAGRGQRQQAAHPKPSLGSSSLCRRFDRISAFPPSDPSVVGSLPSPSLPLRQPGLGRPDCGGDEIGAIIMRAMSRHLGHSIAALGSRPSLPPPPPASAHVLVRRPSVRPAMSCKFPSPSLSLLLLPARLAP